MAQKLNQAKGPVIFLIPTRGWSTADAPGSAAYDPKEDQVFTETLKKMCRPEITIQTVEAYLNDPAFAQAVVQAVHKHRSMTKPFSTSVKEGRFLFQAMVILIGRRSAWFPFGEGPIPTSGPWPWPCPVPA